METSFNPNALDFSAASIPLTLTLSPRRGNQACRSGQLRRMHALSMRKMILPLPEERAGVRGKGPPTAVTVPIAGGKTGLDD